MTTKTPRTDAFIDRVSANHKARNVNDFDHYFNMTGKLAFHSRQLETELSQAKAELADARDRALEEAAGKVESETCSCCLSEDTQAFSEHAATEIRALKGKQ